MQTEILHVTISRPWQDVYDFAHRPENMQQWASGLAAGFTRDADEWLADGGPLGTVRVSFATSNGFGVIDHTVALPSGQTVYNALRVVENGDGAEVMFMVTRQPGMAEDAFREDCAHVQKDLETLKTVMER